MRLLLIIVALILLKSPIWATNVIYPLWYVDSISPHNNPFPQEMLQQTDIIRFNKDSSFNILNLPSTPPVYNCKYYLQKDSLFISFYAPLYYNYNDGSYLPLKIGKYKPFHIRLKIEETPEGMYWRHSHGFIFLRRSLIYPSIVPIPDTSDLRLYKHFYLQNCKNPKRIKQFRMDTNIHIVFRKNTPPLYPESKINGHLQYYTNGELIGINTNKIMIKSRSSTSYTYYMPDLNIDKYETEIPTYAALRLFTFDQDTLYYQHLSKSRAHAKNIGIGVTVTGCVLGLVVAPLVSLPYGSGKFKQERYYKYALAGVAMLGIGIPLTCIRHPREYLISSDPSNTHRKSWRVVPYGESYRADEYLQQHSSQ